MKEPEKIEPKRRSANLEALREVLNIKEAQSAPVVSSPPLKASQQVEVAKEKTKSEPAKVTTKPKTPISPISPIKDELKEMTKIANGFGQSNSKVRKTASRRQNLLKHLLQPELKNLFKLQLCLKTLIHYMLIEMRWKESTIHQLYLQGLWPKQSQERMQYRLLEMHC